MVLEGCGPDIERPGDKIQGPVLDLLIDLPHVLAYYAYTDQNSSSHKANQYR
jgi:hypothetical protein